MPNWRPTLNQIISIANLQKTLLRCLFAHTPLFLSTFLNSICGGRRAAWLRRDPLSCLVLSVSKEKHFPHGTRAEPRRVPVQSTAPKYFSVLLKEGCGKSHLSLPSPFPSGKLSLTEAEILASYARCLKNKYINKINVAKVNAKGHSITNCVPFPFSIQFIRLPFASE